jgi:tight adherence protein C
MVPINQMTPLVIVLIAVGAISLIVAGVTVVSMLRHRAVVRRATGEKAEAIEIAAPLMNDGSTSELTQKLARYVPSSADNTGIRAKLLQAGIDSPTAPQTYFLLRAVSLATFPLIAWFIAPQTNYTFFIVLVLLGAFAGFIVPLAMLDRMVRVRQEAITRSVPDALDLLVVCVEAGISLDAAILRVSRELRFLHGELSEELSVVSRLTNAGVTREKALRGLWERTGVLELRALTSSMVQSERLGTSIATVLRVSAETLRRKRKQAAEKRAKQAPVKMIFPLLLFILPALFVAVLGPAIFMVIKELGNI